MELKPWPEGGLENIHRCPACGSEDSVLMYPSLQDKVFGTDYKGLPMVRCLVCDSVYLQIRPNEQTIGLAYQTYYTHEQTETGDTKLSPLRKFIRSNMNSFRNRKFGLALSPSNRFGFWIVSLFPWLSQGLINEMRSLPKPLPGQRLLDVGCGNGKFLIMAKAMGWDVVGVDFDELAVDAARKAGLTVVHGDVFSISEIESFDYITCSHVIEHVHDPVAVFKAMQRLLKPEGKLWLETPNINSFGHQYYKEHWRGLEPPRHLVIFNYDSLMNLLREVGFVDIENADANLFQYPFVFAASNAIKNGQNAAKVSLFDGFSFTTFWFMLKAVFFLKRREFLTIKAVKG